MKLPLSKLKTKKTIHEILVYFILFDNKNNKLTCEVYE